MDVIFATEELEELWLYAKTLKGKPKYDKIIIDKYQSKVQLLKDADDLIRIIRMSGLYYEKLKGRKEHSIRVNAQYRIEFLVDKKKGNITVCNITRLSNHYKK
jgi:plasmid maintenance system killer protein